MKEGLLFRHHCTTKIKIKFPCNPKSKSRMEGETFEGRMNASSEEAFLQKLLERVEAQGKILEKIISCLSMIEEDDLKEEQDKANHGQSELAQEDID